MIARGSLRLSKSLERNLRERIEVYEFEVGVLQDKPHRVAQDKSEGLGTYAGGPVRKKSRVSSGTVAQVSQKVRLLTGVNYLVHPWRIKSDDAVKMVTGFLRMVFDPSPASKERRLRNLIQAVVRNPILRGDYGKNSRARAREKGFNKLMIDTGQLFQNIKAKVTRKGLK